MTQEEKAKRYDEAIEIARAKYAMKDQPIHQDLVDIFPELAESKNEKMIQYFKDLAPFDKADELYEKYGFSHKDAIAWLEKQCNHINSIYDKELSELLHIVICRYVNDPDISYIERENVSKKIFPYVERLEKQGEHANFLSKIQIGDKVTRNEDGVLVNLSQLNRVANKQGEQKLLYVNDNAKEMFIKALECVEEQNNKGYKLTDCDKNSWWEDFKAYTSCIIEQKPAAWSEEDEKQARQIERIVHDDGCTQKLQKQIADWLKSIKERVQPKQEWSEEDEYCRHQLIVFCENCMVQDAGAKRCAHWLKSLRPQNWKPSKEQMNTLEYYMHTLVCNEYKEVLFGLYADLKKLK